MEDQGHGLLEFGTSVSVNDEIRRTIISEIEETQDSIKNTKKEIALETKVRQQLMKDRSHAAVEIEDLRQRARESFNRLSTLNEGFFADANKTLLEQLCIIPDGEETQLLEKNEEKASSYATQQSTTNENAPPDLSAVPSSMKILVQRQDGCSSKVWKLSAYIQEMQETYRVFRSKNLTAAKNKTQVAYQVQSFQSELSESQLTTKKFSENWQVENDRVRALEGKIRELRVAYQSLLNDIEEKKTSHETKCQALSRIVAGLQAEIKALEESESSRNVSLQRIKNESSILFSRLEEFDAEFKAYSAWKNTFESKREQRESERADRQALFTLQKEMELEWSSRKDEIGKVEKKASCLDKSLIKLDAEIEKAESGIQSANDEIVQMNKVSEELKAVLGKGENDDPVFDTTEEEKELEALQVELETLLQQSDEAEVEIQEQNRRTPNEIESLERKYQQLYNERQNLESDVSGLRMKVQGTADERAQSDLNSKRHLAVLERGAEILEKTNKAEQRYLSQNVGKSD